MVTRPVDVTVGNRCVSSKKKISFHYLAFSVSPLINSPFVCNYSRYSRLKTIIVVVETWNNAIIIIV